MSQEATRVSYLQLTQTEDQLKLCKLQLQNFDTENKKLVETLIRHQTAIDYKTCSPLTSTGKDEKRY